MKITELKGTAEQPEVIFEGNGRVVAMDNLMNESFVFTDVTDSPAYMEMEYADRYDQCPRYSITWSGEGWDCTDFREEADGELVGHFVDFDDASKAMLNHIGVAG